MFYSPRSVPPRLQHTPICWPDETRPFDSVQNLPCNSAKRDGRIGTSSMHRTMYVHFHTARLRRADNLRQNCVAKKRECMCLITLDLVYNHVRKVNAHCDTTWAYTINKITWMTVSRYVAGKWEANLHQQAFLCFCFITCIIILDFTDTNISY